MSEKAEGTKSEAPAGKEAKPAKKGLASAILGILLPALLAAGASFGAVKAASKGGHAEPAHPPAPPRWDPRPPGPTVALDPFLVTVQDDAKKPHPMKLTLAVEFEATVKEETLKAFTPRIRDAVLVYVRSLAYEDVADPKKGEKMREEILERCRKVGAVAAERILVTDMVVQ